jgi:signal transduction histidine kinase
MLGERRTAVDALIAAAILAAGTVQLVLGERSAPLGADLALTAAFALPLAFRRRAPLAVAVSTVVVVLVLSAVESDGSQAVIPLVLVFVAYNAGAHLRAPRDLIGLAVVAGAIAVATAAAGKAEDALFAAVFLGGAWAFGRGLRLRSERAERESGEAAAAERARIARELHDIVSHSITAIVVQTQVVQQRLGDDHARERDDLLRVETTARQAMAEMRRLFGVLRAGDSPASLTPQPGLDQLAALVDDARAGGLDVDVRVEGERSALPPGVDLAAYRIVQEALTNVRRHAGARSAVVELGYGDHDLTVLVEDDGHGTRGNGHPGHGLAGMRERVALYGGELETGERPEGGFRVRARLPVREGGAAP